LTVWQSIRLGDSDQSAAGVAYVLLNSAGGPASLRRFAHEVRPAFADASALQPV